MPETIIDEIDTGAPRVEACINEVMKRFPGESKAALARYFEAVHQELGPLARQLERELRAARADAFPAYLTPALRRVLSMMMWETGPIAHALRATGEDIARKAEDEQAVVLHWLVGFVLKHGDDWHKHAAVALRAMTDSMTNPGDRKP